MAKTRRVILVRTPEGDGSTEGAPMPTLGTRREVLKELAAFNTAPDGSADGVGIAWGPGIQVQLPFVDEREEIRQVLVSMTEEEIAWPVLERLCKKAGWKMMDPDSGRVFGG